VFCHPSESREPRHSHKKIKQAAGTLMRDPDLHDEGVVDEVAGKTQAAANQSNSANRIVRKSGLEKL
jgi:hypothetical protein